MDNKDALVSGLSALFGSGFVGFFLKLAIERTIKRLDKLEASVENISHHMSAFSVRVAELGHFKSDLKEIHSKVIEMSVRAAEVKKDVDAAHEKLRLRR